jgi:hypothetical protein
MSEFGGGVTFGAVKPNENEIYSSPIEDAGVTFGDAESTFEDAGFTQEEDAGVTFGNAAREAPKYSMEEENPYPDGTTQEDWEEALKERGIDPTKPFTPEDSTPEDRGAELNEALANDPFYRNLGSEGARVLYREYKRDLLRKQRKEKKGIAPLHIRLTITLLSWDGGILYIKDLIQKKILGIRGCQKLRLLQMKKKLKFMQKEKSLKIEKKKNLCMVGHLIIKNFMPVHLSTL